MFRIGIVGHRFLTHAAEKYVSRQCRSLLLQYKQSYGKLLAVSLLAAGADTLFAEAALSLSLPLEIGRPFLNYANDFADPGARQHYMKLQHSAFSETLLPHQERSDEAYAAAMYWLVDKSDLLIAAWDGKYPGKIGGTGHAIQQAKRENCPIIHIDTARCRTLVFDISFPHHPKPIPCQ